MVMTIFATLMIKDYQPKQVSVKWELNLFISTHTHKLI
jgi:hypothetical protein